jgi:hypothetical protein
MFTACAKVFYGKKNPELQAGSSQARRQAVCRHAGRQANGLFIVRILHVLRVMYFGL